MLFRRSTSVKQLSCPRNARIPFKRPLGGIYSEVAALTWQQQVADLLSGSCQRDRVTKRADIRETYDTRPG